MAPSPYDLEIRGPRLVRHAALLGVVLLAPAALVLLLARVDDTVVARGKTDFVHWSPVIAQVPARISSVLVAEGQRVSAGDVLLRLDEVELRSRRDRIAEEIRGRRIRLHTLDAVTAAREEERARARERAEFDLEVARAEEAQKGREAEVGHFLWNRGALGRQEAEAARQAHVIAVARRRMQEAAVAELSARLRREALEESALRAEAESELRAGEASLPAAEQALTDAVVRAPRSGFVLTPDPARLKGLRPEPGAVLLVLGEPSELRFVVEVDERDIGKVQSGQPVQIALDAYPSYLYRSLHGRVAEVASSPAPGATRTGPGARTSFRVLIALSPDAGEPPVDSVRRRFEVRPGLAGDATLIVERSVGLWKHLFRSLERHAPVPFPLR